MKKLICLLLACSVLLVGCAGSPIQTGWRASENKKAMFLNVYDFVYRYVYKKLIASHNRM